MIRVRSVCSLSKALTKEMSGRQAVFECSVCDGLRASTLSGTNSPERNSSPHIHVYVHRRAVKAPGDLMRAWSLKDPGSADPAYTGQCLNPASSSLDDESMTCFIPNNTSHERTASAARSCCSSDTGELRCRHSAAGVCDVHSR